MDSIVTIDGLRGLSQDLDQLLKRGITPNIEQLVPQLEAHLAAFSKLLDKKPRSPASRRTLNEGKVTLDDVVFECNREFQEQVIQLADALDLDELEATRLYIAAQEESGDMDRNPAVLASINFHEYRAYLLYALRQICELSLSDDIDEQYTTLFTSCVGIIVDGSARSGPQGLSYIKRCMAEMSDAESWLQRIAEQVQRNVALNTTADPDVDEILHAQQESLVRQHQYLALIVAYLIKGNRSITDDFTMMISHVSKLDKWNMVTVHYIPALLAFISHFGSADLHNIPFDEVTVLHGQIVGARDSGPWPLRHFQAAFISWWVTEYSSWFFDHGSGAQTDTEEERKKREDAFSQALRDGAFQCTLSICAYLRSHDWYDPARLGLTRPLLTEAMSLPSDGQIIDEEFRDMMMEQLEIFIDSFVTNMPDMLRKFKSEEDDERRKLLAGLANGNTTPGSHFLETFFLIVSYAYEGRPHSADNFWSDTEGNLYGFLQWASRRQSTPVVSAFCEMFRALSEGTRNANAAHQFLLDEPPNTSSRVRRVTTLNWSEIFDELKFYADKIKLNPAPVPSLTPGGRSVIADFDEPESIEMLECYLRLISHMCRQSDSIRAWFQEHQSFNLVDTVLLLCRSNSPTRIRTCAYGCLEALLTEKNTEINDTIWSALDLWMTKDFCSKPPERAAPSLPIEEIAARTIASTADEASAFASLLRALVELPASVGALKDQLPFPEQLGSAYRMPGLDMYVDLIFGKLLCQTLPAAQESLQSQILACKILEFANVCLSTFNEDLIILDNQPGLEVEAGILASSLLSYARLHPFNRVMEWMYNERAVKAIFHISHHDIGELNAVPPGAPIAGSVQDAVVLITQVLDLQPTFLNVLRPLLKSQPYKNDRENVVDATIAFFEDSIATNLRIVPDLLYYSGSSHDHLTLASMHLLTKITRSRKLNTNAPVGVGGRTTQNRLISVLQQHHDVEPISKALTQRMIFVPREYAEGPNAPGLQTKTAIVDFLEATLSDVADRPNVAHILLGLDCTGNTLSVADDSAFAQGDSLFHAIVRLAVEFPEAPEGSFVAFALAFKQKVWRIVETLWSSPVSSAPIFADLRDNSYIASRWPAQVILNARTLFEGLTLSDQFFYFMLAPDAYIHYLEQRTALLNYTAAELRLAASQNLELLKAQITSTMLGTTPTPEGNIQNANIFDLLDFVELGVPEEYAWRPHELHAGLDTQVDTILSLYDVEFGKRQEMIAAALNLRQRKLERGGYFRDEAHQTEVFELRDTVLYHAASREKRRLILLVRLRLLKAWVNLISLFLEHAVLEENDKRLFILQALQIASPKLELFASEAHPEAIVFAELAQILLGHLKIQAPGTNEAAVNGVTTVTTDSVVDDGTSERLFTLFRVSLRTICMPTTEAELRTSLYNICYRYMTNPMDKAVAARCVPTIKAMGAGLLDAICEDAYSGEFSCRVAALMLLEAFVNLEAEHKSTYVADNMVRANFVVVLVENIKEMPLEAQQTSPGDIPSLMCYYKAKLALLLALARTRSGAGHVINAGLFNAVATSGLFSTDPDLGLDIDSPDALIRYYELLLAVLQLIVTVVLSRGAQNAQTIAQARTFLLTNRPLMIGILKRQARIGFRDVQEGDVATQQVLNDLSELYVLLISSTGFMEEETKQDTQKRGGRFFS